MEVLDFAALQAAAVAVEPFAHVLVPHFVKAEALAAVVGDLPVMRGRGSFPIGGLRLGARAQALVTALEGPGFRAIVAGKFGLDLQGAPVMTTLRGNAGEKDGRIHTDSVAKRVTVLLYLNPGAAGWGEEGRLRLLRNGQDMDDYAVEVPPVDGALLVFPNGPTTWHGHKSFVGRRYVIQMNYMTTSAKAAAEMRRHHLSAFIKRLTRAA